MNQAISNNRKSDKSKSGVALMMTLGMLSVMMILAVSFTICMRTERVGAGNYRRAVDIRHGLHGVIARAMYELDNRIGDDGYPSASAGWEFSYTNAVDAAVFNGIMDVNDREHFIPDDVVASSMRFTNTYETSTGNEFTYAVLNVSGLLDANYAGGTSRSVGVDVAEIQIADLPGIGNLEDFVDHRDDMPDFPPYETMASMMNVSAGSDEVQSWAPNGSAYFMNYSLCPSGFYDQTEGEVKNVAIPLGSLTTLADAFTYLTDMGECLDLSAQERLVVLSNIIDYQDDDFIPGNYTGNDTPRLNKGYVEPVPMINEIWFGLPSGPSPAVTMSMTTNATGEFQCSLATVGYLTFEFMFPFRDLETPPTTYFNCEIEIIIAFGASSEVILVGPLTPTEFAINTDNVNAAGYTRCQTTPVDMGISPLDLAFSTTVPGLTPNEAFTVKARIKNANVEWNNSGTRVKVDEIPDQFDIVLWSAAAQDGISMQVAAGRECVDPRLNWDDTEEQWPTTSAATLLAENAATTAKLAESGSDGDTWMRVRNKEMESVGELGSIFMGTEPWQTIRLYKHGSLEAHPVFDYFLVGTNTEPRKGVVNPNTFNEEVLEVVFKDMIIRREGSERLRDSDASSIASAIVDNGPYMNIVDVQNNITNWSQLASSTLAGLADPTASDLDTEAIIGNSFGLLGTRQQLFYIVVKGEGAEAIALVWRDPYPNDDGVHPMFLRYLHIL